MKKLLYLLALTLLLLQMGCSRGSHLINADINTIDTVKVYQLGSTYNILVNKIVDKEKIKKIVYTINTGDERLIKFQGNYNVHFTTGSKDTISVIVFGRFIQANGRSYQANDDVEKLLINK